MSVRVQFEIGHEASVRTKKTPDGFTHDWEVFVKGADNTDIQYFVDKVVFHLHETFPKPRRVIKEPPYVVKESGYAGFVLPIDVYLKNKEEPKKISFQYDLTLQNSGPPISRVLREPRVFQNPSEDFRRKLIRGGGVGVDTPGETQMEDHKPSSSLSKSKPIESPNRKHKPELKFNDSFAELFGTPIRRITPEPKKVSELSRKIPDSEKDKKKIVKPHKEDKEATKEKDRYAEREKVKERDKVKEKPLKQQPPVVVKPKEDHKKHDEKDRKKEEYDEKKKRKEEKDKKEKHKENKDVEKLIEKDVRKEKKEPRDNDYLKKLNSSKSHENKISSDKINSDVSEKDKAEKDKHKHRHKKKEKEKNREKEKHKKEKDKSDRDSRERNREKDKLSKKRHDEVKEKEDKMRKRSRTPSPGLEKPKKGPLDALLVELGSSDSASPLSEDEDSIPSFKLTTKTPAKTVPEPKMQASVNVSPKLKSTNLNSSGESRGVDKDVDKHQKSDETGLTGRNRRDRSPPKKSKKNDLEIEKRRGKEHRRRSTSSDREKDEEELERQRQREREAAEALEKEQAEKERLEEEKAKQQTKKEKEANRKRKREKGAMEQTTVKMKSKDADVENNVATSQAAIGGELLDGVEEAKKTADKFTKEYVAQLRDLQHRIMTLEDNDDLQKVVQVIAETGQYEITKKTFDFDLCALDGDTIRRLQEFFSST